KHGFGTLVPHPRRGKGENVEEKIKKKWLLESDEAPPHNWLGHTHIQVRRKEV
ncbi:hypothetical protein SK128_027087, partial [Halocaridina rubra]